MKKKYIYLIILSLFIFIPSANASTKASSQFKNYDVRSSNEGKPVDYKYHAKQPYEKATGNSAINSVPIDGINIGIGEGFNYAEKYVTNATTRYTNAIKSYVNANMPAQSAYKNFSNYQQAVRNLRAQEAANINYATKTAANTTKVLNYAGKGFAIYSAINDAKDLNKESKHKHSSLRLFATTTRYMRVLYTGGSAFVPQLAGASYVATIGNDIVESDEFVNWANEQDNPFLDFLDDATDAINDKAYKDACDLLEWLGINPPNSLPALRTAIKPNIYLYPLEETEISVVFDSPELLLTVIPDYINGWYAKVYPNGKMLVDNEEYGYLFYESMTSDFMMQKDEGFIVPIENRKEFFEYISNYYGFNEQETYDFVTFWCSRLDKNKKYKMYPQLTNTIDILMPVDVNPKPKSIFRIWFLFEEVEEDIELVKPESILAPRDGYTMLEWGGIVSE